MNENLREDIIKVAIEEFNKYGLKFTMDDVAKDLHISKKTIYKVFSDKNEMLKACINYCFDMVKAAEAEIINDKSLDIVEKIKRVIIVLPDGLGGIDWIKVSDTVNTNSELYNCYKERIDSDWEETFALIKQGIEEGKIKDVSLDVLKIMLESSMEGFIRNIKYTDVNYAEALREMIDIVMTGITV